MKLFLLNLIPIIFSSCVGIGPLPNTIVTNVKQDSQEILFGGKAIKGLSVIVKKSKIAPEVIEIALKNESSKNIVIYSSFRTYVGQIGSSSDIFLRVIDTATQKELVQQSGLSGTFLQNSRLKDFSDHHYPQAYVTLKPSEYVSQLLDITSYHTLKGNHKYTVIIEYDHLETGYEQSGNWVEMNAWAGRNASNKLIIQTK
jgi:hypothetical protein